MSATVGAARRWACTGAWVARDLARIRVLAAKGLKASSATLADLRRMIDGLITMAVATTKLSG